MLKPYFKHLVTDRILYPIRQQIAEQVPENSRVIDIGCCTGSLLHILSSRIEEGTGIDIDERMIRFAKKRAEKLKLENLYFEANDFFDFSSLEHSDVAVLSLFLHQFEKERRCEVLRKSAGLVDKLIILDFSNAAGRSFLVKIDELLAGHYGAFADYMKEGMENSIYGADLKVDEYFHSANKFIDLWVCKKEQ